METGKLSVELELRVDLLFLRREPQLQLSTLLQDMWMQVGVVVSRPGLERSYFFPEAVELRVCSWRMSTVEQSGAGAKLRVQDRWFIRRSGRAPVQSDSSDQPEEYALVDGIPTVAAYPGNAFKLKLSQSLRFHQRNPS